jgi:hypothetical protein
MDFLSYNSDYQVVICCRCQYALVPKAIRFHLCEAHEQVTKKHARTCSLYFESLPLRSIADIQQLLPSPLTPPILHLTQFTNGYACTVCPSAHPYITRSTTVLKRHLRERHQWVNPTGKGRESLAVRDSPTHFSRVSRAKVACQTFLPSNRTHYFEVSVKAIKQEPGSQDDDQVPLPRSLLILAE